MRLLHTADWQIGMQAAHVGAAGGRVRDERLTAARRVIEVANRERVDFLLLAGDTFENNAVDRTLVQRVADILGGAACAVWIIPGNHDPLAPGSVWEHPAWRAQPHVQLLRDARPVEIPGGVLFPCPLLEKHSTRDPTSWIEAAGRSEICIGLAHGTVQGVAQDELDYPIPRNAAARCGLDYLAIGHWHSFAPIAAGSEPVRLAYSGTHETTKFGERESGQAVLVEIQSRGAAPKLTPVRTGGLTWLSRSERLGAAGDLGRVRQAVESQADPQQTLLDLKLSGFLFPAEHAELARLREIAASRLLHARIDESHLSPPPDACWLDELPAGLVRDVAAELRSLTDPATPRPGREHATPQVAQRSLLELYALLQEAGE
jgi:calcineurin-like phosphoesterase family protein